MPETTLHGKRITNSTIEATKISATLDQFNIPVAPLNLNSQKITGLADPVANTDADTKGARDQAIAAALAGGIKYKGDIDASTNPNYPAAVVGDLYIFSVAGKIGGASGINVEAKDSITCKIDTVAGDQAAVGTNWNITQGNTDGVVIGPTSAISDNIVTFNGISGKVIKDSGISISSLTPSNFVTNETPTGLVNGINTIYTLANTPISGSEQLYISGLALSNPSDYTISTNTITAVSPPLTGESIKVSYRY